MPAKLLLDPEKIVNQEFSIDFQGYNPDQVDLMLDNVIKDYQTYDKMIEDTTTTFPIDETIHLL